MLHESIDLSSQSVGEYHFSCFHARIYAKKDQIQPILSYNCDIQTQNLINELVLRVRNSILSQDSPTKILKLEKVLIKVSNILDQEILLLDKVIIESEMELIKPVILLELLGIGKLAPLLIDTRVEEIYYSEQELMVYIDHADFGRCKTEIHLSTKEITSFLARVMIENSTSLSKINPSMKADLVSSYFHARVTADIPPLAADGYTISIRKLYHNTLQLPDLIENETLTSEAAALILFALLQGANCTIVGAPSVGKTTFQNALLAFIPDHWRLVTIEDVLESEPRISGGHLVRFKVTPLEAGKITHAKTKTIEVTKLLHRSPDYLCLGEISTAEHAKAWFHALCAGIPSIQTVHGANVEALLRRLKQIFQIPSVLIRTSAPHILIEMRSKWIGAQRLRKVVRIVEISEEIDNQIEKIHLAELFKYDPNTEMLQSKTSITSSTMFKYFQMFEPKIKEEIDSVLREISRFLLENNYSSSFKTLYTLLLNKFELFIQN
ncbi:MAG: ATPase, T2SS/T4P/T4SS family [Promethearchaeota archaeon]